MIMTARMVIGLLLFLLGVGVGYTLGVKAGQSARSSSFVPTRTPTVPVALSPTQSAEKATNSREAADYFYTSYLACIKNKPKEAEGSISAYCQLHNPYATQSLIPNLETTGVVKAGADPILCIQGLPRTIRITNTIAGPQNGKTTAFVSETSDSGTSVQILAEVIVENTLWKVNNIICPRP